MLEILLTFILRCDVISNQWNAYLSISSIVTWRQQCAASQGKLSKLVSLTWFLVKGIINLSFFVCIFCVILHSRLVSYTYTSFCSSYWHLTAEVMSSLAASEKASPNAVGPKEVRTRVRDSFNEGKWEIFYWTTDIFLKVLFINSWYYFLVCIDVCKLRVKWLKPLAGACAGGERHHLLCVGNPGRRLKLAQQTQTHFHVSVYVCMISSLVDLHWT